MMLEELTPVPGAETRYDDDGAPIVEVMTCGTCGRSWNDAAVSSVTPVPAGRCPFEYDHELPDELEEPRTWALELTGPELVTAANAIEKHAATTTHPASRSLLRKVRELRDAHHDERDPAGAEYRRRRREAAEEA